MRELQAYESPNARQAARTPLLPPTYPDLKQTPTPGLSPSLKDSTFTGHNTVRKILKNSGAAAELYEAECG